MSRLQSAATAELSAAFGAGEPPATAFAPGRCTLVGEHVDYAGGRIACVATDLGVAVAVRESPDGRWRVASGGRRVERETPVPSGDIGDRPFAAALALGRTAPLELGIAADLPEGAGLSSSAALISATVAALLRLDGRRLPAGVIAATAYRAEHDIVGIPCGTLDQRAVVEAPAHGVLCLDCRDGTAEPVPWPWEELVLVACDTGTAHDVGGEGYRSRRAQAEAALQALGVATCQDAGLEDLEVAGLDPLLRRRARHLITESGRVDAAAAALRAGDAAALGALMDASHNSLRDDYEVSTPELDHAVAAARHAGCLGARLVGAGFGGSAVALCEANNAEHCAAAMREASGASRAWSFRPAAGLAALDPGVIGAAH